MQGSLTSDELIRAMQGLILEETALVGTYERKR